MENLEVFNLSSIVLPPSHLYILGLGLKYLPLHPYSTPDLHTSLDTSLTALHRRITLNLYFARYEGEDDPSPYSRLLPRPPSTWLPDKRSKWTDPLEQYIAQARLQGHQAIEASKPRWSADAAFILSTIKTIRDDTRIIIKPADKNLGLVVLTRAQYEDVCNAHLQDTSQYQDVTGVLSYPVLSFAKLRKILSNHNLLFSKSNQGTLSPTARSLLQLEGTSPRISPFYCLPKMHKKVGANGLPPGRPIISAPSSATYHTSIFLHRVLHPLISSRPTVCKGSHEVLQRIKNWVNVNPSTAVIYTADVAALYPSIPIDFGVQKVGEFLGEFIPHDFPYSIDFLLHLLRWTLTNNYCTFNDRVYLQLQGTAMGTPVAVSYANIVLYMMERSLRAHAQLYFRFIDDLFIVFRTAEHALEFHSSFNGIHPAIQLDPPTIGQTGIFMDLQLTLRVNPSSQQYGHLSSCLYQKPANIFSYIPACSHHAPHVLRNFIREELKRYSRSCTEDRDYIRFKDLFRERLLKRGYSGSQIALAMRESDLGIWRGRLTHPTPPLFSTPNPTPNPIPNPNPRPNPTPHPYYHPYPNPKPYITLALPPLTPPVNWKQVLDFPEQLTRNPTWRLVYGHSGNSGTSQAPLVAPPTSQGTLIVGRANPKNISHLLLSSLYRKTPDTRKRAHSGSDPSGNETAEHRSKMPKL